MQPPAHLATDLPKTLEMHRVLGPKMMSCITPIAGSLRDRTFQYGTGTFFRAADFFFLVTAAHVLKVAKRDNVLLRILDGESKGGQVQYQDVALPKWQAYIGEDPADVAILPLSDEVVAALPKRTFLRLDEVATGASHSGVRPRTGPGLAWNRSWFTPSGQNLAERPGTRQGSCGSAWL
jgi:hypothetical protein